MMNRKMLAGLVLAFTEIAQAGVVVTMDPAHIVIDADDPRRNFDINLGLMQSPGGSDDYLRLLSFDFAPSSPELMLNVFWFYSGPIPDVSLLYAQFPDLPYPQIAWSAFGENRLGQFKIPGDGSVVSIGAINITVPQEPGEWTLDAGGTQAIVAYGFGTTPDDPYVELTPSNGLSSNVLTIVVVPAPATLILMIFGTLLISHGRRANRLRVEGF